MRQLNQITASMLKEIFPAERFYPLYLDGMFGRHCSNGWYLWNGLCPFHDDRNPGTFFIHKETGAFICHACGTRGGDIIDFYMKKNALGFKDAFQSLRRAVPCAK